MHGTRWEATLREWLGLRWLRAQADFGAPAPKPQLPDLQETYIQLAVFALAILALAVIIAIARRLYKKWSVDEETDDGDDSLMSELRDLQDEGELTPEEYRKVKDRLAERMRRKLGG